MRLICPNCDAEYEVDDAAIPKEGRDVQCSACGHAWFQTHPEIEAEAEAEAALYEAPEGAVAPSEPADDAAVAAEDEDPPATEAQSEPGEEPEAELPSAAARGLDASMLAVLKEEAERETAARRAEAQGKPVLESQTEMPLPPLPAAAAGSSMAAAVKRIAKLRGVAVEEDAKANPAQDDSPAQDGEAEAGPATKARRKSFPAIEEINQSLRAAGDRGQDDDDAVAETLSAQAAAATEARGGGFRRGFVTLVALAVLIVVLYQFAPVIAAKVPALEGAMRSYVEAVDSARIAVDGLARGLIDWLRGLAGGSAG